MNVWRILMAFLGYQDMWDSTHDGCSPSFHAEIDRVVAEVEEAR